MNKIYLLYYNNDLNEGMGRDILVKISDDIESLKKLGEKMPMVMGCSPTARIEEYPINTNLIEYNGFPIAYYEYRNKDHYSCPPYEWIKISKNNA